MGFLIRCNAVNLQSLILERKKPWGPKMIVLVRIPQAQSSWTEQPTSNVDGRTSNLATGTEPKEATLLSLNLIFFFNHYYYLLFTYPGYLKPATFTITFPHTQNQVLNINMNFFFFFCDQFKKYELFIYFLLWQIFL